MENMALKNFRAIDSEFWQGKRVLITGHTGFKGSWLSLWLQSMGANLCGVALKPSTNPALFDVADIGHDILNSIADIRSYVDVHRVIADFQPEIIIHMAAQPLVRLSYQQPMETYSTNIMGTLNVLEAARHVSSVRAIVNVTTDKCYDNKEWVWGYREHEPMGGHDPYSSSKGCAELVSSAYRESFLHQAGIALATARAGNVIGGGDWSADRLIPDILRAWAKNECVAIRNPSSIRPWQHVLEPLSGYLLLARKLYENGQEYAEAWNFGPNDEDSLSVQCIVEQLRQNWGLGAHWQLDSGKHPHEASFLKLDISKSRQRLRWQPVWDLHTALLSIVEWYKSWLAGDNMRAVCLKQIREYNQTVNADDQ